MGEVSPDQFKVQVLRRRVAELSLEHEDARIEWAIEKQLLVQECEKLREELRSIRESESENSPVENFDN